MLKITVILAIVSVFGILVEAQIDASSLGIPSSNKQNAFGAAIPETSGLADQGEVGLQLVDPSVNEESDAANVNHVKEMFSNALSSLQDQQQLAKAQLNTTQPSS